MLQITKKYRHSYTSEDIIVERKYQGGHWHDTAETVVNAVTNTQISNRAVVIGNGANRLGFNLEYLKNPSGLLGATTLQTYGCNALYRDFAPDFLVATGSSDFITEIANSDYPKDHIVYSNANNLLEHPGKFYLVPHDPYTDAGTTAAYIAAFDGHTRIYLMGFDGQDTPGFNHNVYAGTNGYDPVHSDYGIISEDWRQDLSVLCNTYSDVDFVWVTPFGSNIISRRLKPCQNFRQISHRDLVLEADL